MGREIPVENDRRPPPPSPLTWRTRSRTVRVIDSESASSDMPRTATTSWLNPTTGALASRCRTTRAHAVANRSCMCRSSSGASSAELAPEELRHMQERFATAWARVVRQRDAKAPVVGFSQEVVAVLGMSEDADSESITRAVRDVVRHVSGDGGGGRRSFSTGSSRPISSPDELPGAYEQARKAVSVGRQMSGPSALTHFDGLGIFRLLTLVPDTAELRSFAAEALGQLITNDTAENADLRRTLSVLLDTNLNVAETARILHFHY